MKKSILLLVIIFLSGWVFTKTALAYEGECHLKHCLVPSPTVLGPEQGDVVNTQRPGIKGLTWKTTVVKVFIDGIEVPEVKQIKHQDYYGSFYAEPDYNLAPGVHYIYTIAQSEKPGWYDQSQESAYVYFTVELPVPVAFAPKTPIKAPVDAGNETNKSLSDEASNAIAPITEPAVSFQQIDINEQSESAPTVQVEKGKIEGGVSVEQDSFKEIETANQTEQSDWSLPNEQTKTDDLNLQGAAGLADLGEILKDEFVNQEMAKKAKENRIIGLAVLAIIVLFSAMWLVADKRWFKKDAGKNEDDGLPPPPTPPQKKEKGKKLKDGFVGNNQQQPGAAEEKKSKEVLPPPIEPLNSPSNSSNKYFATPPYSPHSPYPSRLEESSYVPLKEEAELFDAEQELNEIEGKYAVKSDQKPNELF